MHPFPSDLFTEQGDIDPDTLKNLGPLARLAGRWEARAASTSHPRRQVPSSARSSRRSRSMRSIRRSNGPQTLYGLRYHIHITTREEDITFHDQVGYWLWEPATGLVIQTLAIPRGQVLLASGHAAPGDDALVLTARRGETEYGICSTAFLEYGFRTDTYRLEITFAGEDAWSYDIQTTLTVHGQPAPFDHHDRNTLKRVAAGKPNPLKQILDRRAAKDSPHP